MRLLFCCEYYHPSRGGVQEVMRQIAERMVQAGHEVTIATTKLTERDFKVLNGVKIAEFAVSGNRVNGMTGELERYQAFLKAFDGDAILIKAAQQWTFDATWPVLDQVKVRKVFIPCGFSGLYLPQYKGYFEAMPDVLRKFDHLIFYAERYRDIDLARAHGITNFTILPNGASEVEFATPRDDGFRARQGIGRDDFVILTVGTPINAKGHTEVAGAFALLDSGGQPMTLILIGQWRNPVAIVHEVPQGSALKRAIDFYRRRGVLAIPGRLMQSLTARADGLLRPLRARVLSALRRTRPSKSIDAWIGDAEAQPGKRVMKTHFDRPETIQAFLNADLFVFASNIEYSPLVLFEAAAAGLPFITVPVGNGEEIVRWTGGGVLCPAEKTEQGFTQADPEVLAREIGELQADPARLRELGAAGRRAFEREFNWSAIARRYAAVLEGGDRPRPLNNSPTAPKSTAG